LAGIVIVVIVLVMIIKALASGGSDESKNNKAPKPSQSTSATVALPSQQPAPACVGAQLTGPKLAPDGSDILLTKSQESYPEGQPVIFNAKVKNTSNANCSLLNNPHNVVLHVVSKDDRIYDSSDCSANTPAEAGDSIVLKAGEEAYIPITWEPARSQQGCPEISQKPVRHEKATYIATVKILDVDSDATSFLLVP
jgi:hypothetical protein